MCGIAGILYKDLSVKDDRRFEMASNLSKHRGPDYTGSFIIDKIHMVHHRLSILDLDERSHQPFKSSDNGSSVLIYNGEIYNFKELASKYNLSLNTTSDTEVLFKLLQLKNFDLNELNGIFAFGLYDPKKNFINITRDRLGVKPLYYYDCDQYFIFSSEAKVIYAYLKSLKINYQALTEYLTFGHSASEQTLINGVKKLQPGFSLKVDLSDYSLKLDKYWSIEQKLLNNQLNTTYEEALDNTKLLLERAIQRQCVSDVQVGAYLSGGIDSSAVVAIASKHTEKKLNTYSVNFDKNPDSELKLASMLAKKYQTNHHEFEVSTKNIEDYLSDLIFQYDEPFADPAMIPLHLIAEKASEFSKVVLQGDGGDEIFAGYGRHLDLKQYQYRKWMFQLLKYFHPKKEYYKKRHEELNHSTFSEVMANLVQSDLNVNYGNVLHSEIYKRLYECNPINVYKLRDNKFNNLPLMQRMLYTDMEIILPNKFLEKVDKVNMFHSIEARVPLLDNDLVDYVARLPQNIKIQKSTTKYFFRDVLQGIVPEEILNAKKSSFGTPIAEWLRTTLFDFSMEQFNEGEKKSLPINYSFIKDQLIQHKSKSDSSKSGLIWRTLVLTIWMSKYHSKLKF